MGGCKSNIMASGGVSVERGLAGMRALPSASILALNHC